MNRFLMTASAMTLVVSLGACQGTGMGTKEGFGTLIGAGGGALAGSQIGGGKGKLAAVAVGALLGAFVGNRIGQSLDRADKAAMQRSTVTALEHTPDHQFSSWNNPNSKHYGNVQPISTYRTPAGQYCREYIHTVYIGGKTEKAYGEACRMPDGTWELQ